MIAPVELALGFARAAAFVAATPLGRAGSVPRIIRVVLAITLAPIVAAARPANPSVLDDWTAFGFATLLTAAQGAAVGLCATIVAGAAAAAGGLVDSALAAQPAPSRDIFGESGPVGLVCTSAFGWFFFRGPFERLTEVVATADSKNISATAVAALARVCMETALACAGPAIVSQGFAAVLAAGIARIAPRVNGMFLAAPIASLLVVASLLAGGGAMLWAIAEMTWRAVAAAGALP